MAKNVHDSGELIYDRILTLPAGVTIFLTAL